jgi:lipoyl-dependent peroxiredoxin
MIRKAKAIWRGTGRDGDGDLSTEAAVTLDPDGPQDFKVSRSALTLRAQVPGISAEKFSSIARDAERNCPVSKVLKAEITLDAKLD